MRPVLAEALGTFWIVLVVGGLLAEGVVAPGLAAGAAAGLAYLAAALTLGQITMGHFNPALTLGLRAAGGFGGSLTFTLLAQIVGASLALLMVGAPPALAADLRPFAAMLLLVPLVTLPVLVHLSGMRLRTEAVAYANAAALAAAVALAPGGHGGLSAAHATAAWLTGDGAPIGLWRVWLATGIGVALAAALWGQLAEERGHATKAPGSDADDTDDADEDEIAQGPDTPKAVPRRGETGADLPLTGEAPGEMNAAQALLAQARAAQVLVDAGWTPPAAPRGTGQNAKDTRKGRVPKNAPLKPTRRKGG